MNTNLPNGQSSHGGHQMSLSLDGVNDFGNLGIQDWFRPQGTGMTISAWFRPELKGTEMGIVSFGSLAGSEPGFALSMAGQASGSDPSQLIFALNDGVGAIQTRTYAHTSLLVGNWQHVGLTIDGEQVPTRSVRLYLNGMEVDSFPFTETNPWGAVLQPLVLGAKSAGSSHYFKGQLDDLRFVPYALEGEQHFLWMMENPYPAMMNTLHVSYTYDHQNRLISRTADPDGLAGPAAAVTKYFIHDGVPLAPSPPSSGERVAEGRGRGSSSPASSALANPDAALVPSNLNEIGQIVLRISPDGQVIQGYLWSDQVDQLLAQELVIAATSGPQSAGEVDWSLTDHLGTIRDLVRYDAQSTSVQSVLHRTYDSYGNITSDTTTTAADMIFAFTGRLYDPATGLQNNLNRWYDARVGRWISEDPIGFAGGDANLYRYVANSVTNLIDPSGNVWYKPWTWFQPPPPPPKPPINFLTVGLPKDPKTWTQENWVDYLTRKAQSKFKSKTCQQNYLDSIYTKAKKSGNRTVAEAAVRASNAL